MSLTDLVNLDLAFDRVLKEESKNELFISDSLKYLDERSKKEEIVSDITSRIDSNQFEAKELVMMNVSKGDFFLRPGTCPRLDDRILYNALIHFIAARIDRHLSRSVLSMRYDRRAKQLRSGVSEWLKFEAKFWDYYNDGYQYVLVTDVTSYFAHIHLQRLRGTLLTIINDNESTLIVDFLMNKILNVWARQNIEQRDDIGIPQGLVESFVLANAYLHYVDGQINNLRNIKYVRYVDDIRILGKDERAIKKALMILITELQKLGLDLNEKKTNIFRPDEVKENLLDRRQGELNAIQAAIDSNLEPAIRVLIPLLKQIYRESFSSRTSFGSKHLGFALYRFIRVNNFLEEDFIKEVCIELCDNLSSNPSLASKFSQFFKYFPMSCARDRIFSFLRSQDNIYDWQAMHLVDALLRCDSITRPQKSYIERMVLDSNLHPALRAKAILCYGNFGDEHNRNLLKDRFSHETSYLVKRALIIGTQELGTAEKNAFYGRIKRASSDYNHLIEFLNGRSAPLYFYDEPPHAIPLTETAYF